MAFDTPPYQFTGAHRYPPLPLGSRVPMQMPPFMSEYEQDPPWKKKKSSLFWQDQLDRVPETSWFSQMPHWVQGPMDAWKSLMLGGEVASEKSGETLSKVVSGLGQTKKEREARLLQERKDEAAKEQALVQERRRMPTTVDKSAIAQKGGDNNDMLRYLLLMNFLQNIAYQSAAPDVRPGYGTSTGTSRAFPTMPKM